MRSERVESRGKKMASKWNKNFLNFTSYFPTNIKNTFIYLGLEAMMKKKGKK